jgi:hypothetical protein
MRRGRSGLIVGLVLLLVLSAGMILLMPETGWAVGSYDGGNGLEGSPFEVRTAEQLNEIGQHSEDWGSYFILTADIDLSGYDGQGDNPAFNIIGISYTPHFTGSFDGNDYTISNFTYTSPDPNFIGLFGTVGNNGRVKQLVMENVNASGNWFTAGLVGLNFGRIHDCTINGTISGNSKTGGLAGANYGEISDCSVTTQVQGADETGGLAGDNHGMISDCYGEGEVSGYDDTGGLVGVNSGTIWNCYTNSNVDGNSATGGLVGENIGLIGNGSISWSYATGKVTGDGFDTGGLVGINGYGTVSYCYATGNIDANNGAGGLVGWNIDSTISNCYSTASVLGDNHIGGLVGVNSDSTIADCYSVGVVEGNDDTGGLIGDDHDGTITDCFWDTENSGQSSSDGPEAGKSTADMKKENIFTDAGWDFVGIWDIGENQTYPYLRVYPTGDLNHDGIVNLPDFAIMADHWLEGVE